MSNEEAYNELLQSRDTIIRVMENVKHEYDNGVDLANRVLYQHDSESLANLIRKAANHIIAKKEMLNED